MNIFSLGPDCLKIAMKDYYGGVKTVFSNESEQLAKWITFGMEAYQLIKGLNNHKETVKYGIKRNSIGSVLQAKLLLELAMSPLISIWCEQLVVYKDEQEKSEAKRASYTITQELLGTHSGRNIDLYMYFSDLLHNPPEKDRSLDKYALLFIAKYREYITGDRRVSWDNIMTNDISNEDIFGGIYDMDKLFRVNIFVRTSIIMSGQQLADSYVVYKNIIEKERYEFDVIMNKL